MATRIKKWQLSFGVILVVSVLINFVLINNGQAAKKVESKILPTVSYLKYEEPDVMEQTGMMYGISGEVFYIGDENKKVTTMSEFASSFGSNINAGVQADFRYGQADYESDGTGSIDNIDQYLFEIRPLLGYDFVATDATTVTPYLGFGYRYYFDNSTGTVSSTGYYGYDRESNYYYLPVGVDLKQSLNDNWDLGFNLEYDAFIGGKQISHLEDVDSSYPKVENDQNSGFGVRGAITLEKKAEIVNWLIQPFINYWDIDDSDDAVACTIMS